MALLSRYNASEGTSSKLSNSPAPKATIRPLRSTSVILPSMKSTRTGAGTSKPKNGSPLARAFAMDNDTQVLPTPRMAKIMDSEFVAMNGSIRYSRGGMSIEVKSRAVTAYDASVSSNGFAVARSSSNRRSRGAASAKSQPLGSAAGILTVAIECAPSALSAVATPSIALRPGASLSGQRITRRPLSGAQATVFHAFAPPGQVVTTSSGKSSAAASAAFSPSTINTGSSDRVARAGRL